MDQSNQQSVRTAWIVTHVDRTQTPTTPCSMNNNNVCLCICPAHAMPHIISTLTRLQCKTTRCCSVSFDSYLAGSTVLGKMSARSCVFTTIRHPKNVPAIKRVSPHFAPQQSVKSAKTIKNSTNVLLKKPAARIKNKANVVHSKENVLRRNTIAPTETVFEKDIATLIELSKQFQKSCAEESKPRIRSAAGLPTTKSWPCMTTNVRGKIHFSRNAVSDPVIKPSSAATNQMSLMDYGLGETVVPPIFDDQLMKDYGNRLVDMMFDNPFIVHNAYQQIQKAASEGAALAVSASAKAQSQETIRNIYTRQPQTPITATPRSAQHTNRSMVSQRSQLMNDKSKNIVKKLVGSGRAIQKHSCVNISSASRSMPRPSDRSGGKQQYLSKYYDFKKTHPDIKLVPSDSVLPRREIRPVDQRELDLPLETLKSPTISISKHTKSTDREQWHERLSNNNQTNRTAEGKEATHEKPSDPHISQE